MRGIQVATPCGPRRWAHRTRKAPSSRIARGGVAGAGGFDDGDAGAHGALADRRQQVERGGIAGVGVDPGDARAVGERADGGVGVAGVDGVREPLDPSAEAVDGAEHDDAVADRHVARAGARVPSTAEPVASSTAARTAALMRGASAAGPTMSPSTAPASIEVSWPGSPTRISRASRRTASVRRAISESDTIEVSSTITTS